MNEAKCNTSDIVSIPVFEMSGKGKSIDTESPRSLVETGNED